MMLHRRPIARIRPRPAPLGVPWISAVERFWATAVWRLIPRRLAVAQVAWRQTMTAGIAA